MYNSRSLLTLPTTTSCNSLDEVQQAPKLSDVAAVRCTQRMSFTDEVYPCAGALLQARLESGFRCCVTITAGQRDQPGVAGTPPPSGDAVVARMKHAIISCTKDDGVDELGHVRERAGGSGALECWHTDQGAPGFGARS